MTKIMLLHSIRQLTCVLSIKRGTDKRKGGTSVENGCSFGALKSIFTDRRRPFRKSAVSGFVIWQEHELFERGIEAEKDYKSLFDSDELQIFDIDWESL